MKHLPSSMSGLAIRAKSIEIQLRTNPNSYPMPAKEINALFDRFWKCLGTLESRPQRNKRRGNTRVIAVQAKRKQLGLDHDGRVFGRTRKESYAIAIYGHRGYLSCFVSERDMRRRARRERYQWHMYQAAHCASGYAMQRPAWWDDLTEGVDQ